MMNASNILKAFLTYPVKGSTDLLTDHCNLISSTCKDTEDAVIRLGPSLFETVLHILLKH